MNSRHWRSTTIEPSDGFSTLGFHYRWTLFADFTTLEIHDHRTLSVMNSRHWGFTTIDLSDDFSRLGIYNQRTRSDELSILNSLFLSLSDEFSALGMPVWACKLIIDNAIEDLVNSRWEVSGTDRKLQRCKPSTVVVIIMGHCIKGTHARRIPRSIVGSLLSY